jgi:hypothetical protein
LVFVNVLAVHSNNAEGMLIYALSELRHEPPHRRFAFGNWNEDDPSMLEVVAEKFTVANLEAS